MSLLTHGAGLQNLLTGGLGERVPHTTHEPASIFADPSLFGRERDTDGAVEQAFATPVPNHKFNSRSVTLYLPAGYELPPAALSRLRDLLEIVRPATCAVRVEETRGPLRLVVEDPAEEVS